MTQRQMTRCAAGLSLSPRQQVGRRLSHVAFHVRGVWSDCFACLGAVRQGEGDGDGERFKSMAGEDRVLSAVAAAATGRHRPCSLVPRVVVWACPPLEMGEGSRGRWWAMSSQLGRLAGGSPAASRAASQWQPARGSGPVAEGARAGRGARAEASASASAGGREQVRTAQTARRARSTVGGRRWTVDGGRWTGARGRGRGPVRRRWLRGRRAGYGVLVVAAAS